MKYTIVTLLLLASIALTAATKQDSVTVQVAAWESPWRSYNNYFDYNPSATFAVPVKKFTEVGGSNVISNSEKGFHLVQEGTGTSVFKLHSESFQVDSCYRFFGDAYYSNHQEFNIGWRDVEDYNLLNPYLVADSVGGTYKGESYFLSGGASMRVRNMEWAIRASYQGDVSYRQVDPRPRNTVSVIHINPGVTYQHGNWRYGLFGEYIRYRQNVDIQVEKADRKIYFYLLQGFGIYNQQFSILDESYSRIYKGNLYNAGFHVNNNCNGQSTGVLIELKKAGIQVDENDKRTPYKLNHNEIISQLTHERELLHRSLFLKGLYSYHQTIGNETQYTPVTINTTFIEWQFATQSDRYQSVNQDAQFSALLADKNLSEFSIWERIDGTWHDSRQYYYYPDYHQYIQDASASGTIGLNCPMKKGVLEGSIQAGYKKNIESDLFQNENNIITTQMLLPDYAFLTSDVTFYKLNIKFRLPIKTGLLLNVSTEAALQSAKE
ncbi:MAG: hypothetical protein PHT07_21295, partial [Paludibacter sp.]|nr:hypothetical protein [Paludibacter sp.]